MMVVLIRGLSHPWEQQVYLQFDVLMKKPILLQIINLVESCGLKVAAIESDLGGSGSEIRLATKVDEQLQTGISNDRQDVDSAKFLFSETIARAILTLDEENRSSSFLSSCRHIFFCATKLSARLTNTINTWKTYATQEQLEVLHNIESVTEKMRTVRKKSMTQFQKGILVSLSPVLGLIEYMNKVGFP
ncbi:hypothetical protein PR048_000936 [Dryococelus australis]|uniref:Uncharacterized protein n=1 Tax=Dryococelus australis TaxID=614101 RepID=A0ABQ9IHE8_9NEOP|nr:hypothetical protein PR048_000936 [Dryococelus australis]